MLERIKALVVKEDLQVQLRTAKREKWRRDKGNSKSCRGEGSHSLAPASAHLSIYCALMLKRTLERLMQRMGVKLS